MSAGAIPLNAQLALVGVFAILSLATLALMTVAALMPDRDLGELRLRVRSWWVMAVVFTVAVAFHRTVSLVFFAMVSFLALKEFMSLVPTRQTDRLILLMGYLTIPAQYVLIAQGRYEIFMVFVPLGALLMSSTGMVLIGNTAGFLRAAGTLSWGLMITVFALGHLGLLVMLPASINPVAGSTGLVLYLVLLSQSGDVAQYIFGKCFGRRKILPRVSPNKTWAGLIGGVVSSAVLGATLAPWLTPFGPWQGLLVGMAIAAAGFMGDATISALKRDMDVKDTGTLLPGHGGILDRVDSLIFSAPLFFHLVYTVKL